jgi:hypothetical protein
VKSSSGQEKVHELSGQEISCKERVPVSSGQKSWGRKLAQEKWLERRMWGSRSGKLSSGRGRTWICR